MPPALLTDADVEALTPAAAVQAARRALVDAHRGALAAPPRVPAAVADGALVFTVGGYAPGPVGVRVHRTGAVEAEQATLVWDRRGRLAAVVVGDLLAERRTGALGAVAIDALARADAATVGLVGSGRQAWAQVWAMTAVRPRLELRVFSRAAERREAFAARARAELGVRATAARSAREAVDGAEIVVLATVATAPVVDAAWVRPDAHVTTVGPKTAAAHECPEELAARAAVAVSDSPAQTRAYGEPCFTARPLEHLGAVVAGDAGRRAGPDSASFYLSTGLAGSEIVVAAALPALRGV